MIEIVWPAWGEEVQHCNSRTEYEMIIHPYNPRDCNECLRILELYLRLRFDLELPNDK